MLAPTITEADNFKFVSSALVTATSTPLTLLDAASLISLESLTPALFVILILAEVSDAVTSSTVYVFSPIVTVEDGLLLSRSSFSASFNRTIFVKSVSAAIVKVCPNSSISSPSESA